MPAMNPVVQIAKATAAGIRAAQIAPLVHASPEKRDSIRAWIREHESENSAALLAELEARWAGKDAGVIRHAVRRGQ
jgi:hypothetical protein